MHDCVLWSLSDVGQTLFFIVVIFIKLISWPLFETA